jgi:hypothetical protein
MTFSRITSISFLLGAFALIPTFVSAQQVYGCGYPYTYNAYYCGAGAVDVYVQVASQTGTPLQAPSDFTITVTGQNPSPATFAGSQKGTTVLMGDGAYSMKAVQTSYGFTPTYSQGCTGTIARGQRASCIVTMTPGFLPYQPSYTGSRTLSCAPAYQTIPAGQNATFTAVGGDSATYIWSVPGRTYSTFGNTTATTLTQIGTQNIVVSSGYETATCTVEVTAFGGIAPTITTSFIPAMPNTGFDQRSAGYAFALVALLSVGLFMYPHVRARITRA